MCGFEDVMWLFNTDKTRKVSRVNIDEAAMLWRLLRDTTGTVVEIGSRFGGTTALILLALNGERKLVSIDLSPEHKPEVVEIIEEGKSSGVLEMVLSDSGTHVLDDGVGLLFVDGDHSYEGVKRDIRSHWNSVVDGGIILFHDASPDKSQWKRHKDVEDAVGELVSSGAGEEVEVVRSMVALRKVKDI